MFVAAALFLIAAPAAAQGFGIGGRLAWIKTNSEIEELDEGSTRFYGGHIRLSGARVGVEVSLDRHTETLELLNQKVTETPFQVSLMLKLAGGSVQPYLLGGPGWYYRSVSPSTARPTTSTSARTTSDGMQAAASKFAPASTSVSMGITATPSSTLATMTTRKSTSPAAGSSAAFSRATRAR